MTDTMGRIRTGPFEATQALRQLAERRWGEVPVTTEVREWDDGDFHAAAFHTFSVPDFEELVGIEVTKPCRAELRYDSANDILTEMVVEVEPETATVRYHERLKQ